MKLRLVPVTVNHEAMPGGLLRNLALREVVFLHPSQLLGEHHLADDRNTSITSLNLFMPE